MKIYTYKNEKNNTMKTNNLCMYLRCTTSTIIVIVVNNYYEYGRLKNESRIEADSL